MASQLIRFDNGTQARGGLSLSLTRDTATLDPLGNMIAVDTPRYGQPAAVHERTAPVSIGTYTSAGRMDLMGAGVQSDGESPLVVCKGIDNPGLILWHGSAGGQPTTQINVNSSSDVLGDDPIASITHTLRSALVIHGLVVYYVDVTKGTKKTASLIFSQDTSTTRTRATIVSGEEWTEDSNYPETFQTGNPSLVGREWALNWFPLDSNSRPLSVAITFTDYQNWGGGTCYLVIANRASVDDAWVTGDVRTLYNHPQVGAVGNGEHAHSCGIIMHEGVMYAAAIFGDGKYCRTTLITIGDPDDYETASLTLNEEWSGELATDGTTTVPQRYSPQPGSVMPLPNGDLVCCTDVGSHAFSNIVKESVLESRARWYGTGPQKSNNSSTSNAFSLFGRFHRDAIGDLYVALQGDFEGELPNYHSKASLDGSRWFDMSSKIMWGVCGNWIVGAGVGAADTRNLYAIPRPTISNTKSGRPLIVQKGGTNLHGGTWPTFTPNATRNGHKVINLRQAQGDPPYVWPTGFDNEGDAVPLPPGFELTADSCLMAVNTNSATSVTFLNDDVFNGKYVADSSTTLTYQASPNINYLVRCWVASMTDDIDFSMDVSSLGVYDDRRILGIHDGRGDWFISNRIRPCNISGYGQSRISPSCASAISQGDFVIWFEMVTEGGIPPYHLDYGVTGSNEVARITGLSIDGDWSVSADISYPRDFGVAHSVGPLLTVWEDANNHVLVETADNAANGYPYEFRVTVTVAGVPTSGTLTAATAHDTPGSDMRVTVSKVGTGTVLRVQNAGVQPVDSVTVASNAISAPSEVKLASNADASTVNYLLFHAIAIAETSGDAEDSLGITLPPVAINAARSVTRPVVRHALRRS